jgi:cytochrome bd-type quinol oxidase subunit 1
VGQLQPAKLAAMEALYRTQTGAPVVIGGIPNDETRTIDYALRRAGFETLTSADGIEALAKAGATSVQVMPPKVQSVGECLEWIEWYDSEIIPRFR